MTLENLLDELSSDVWQLKQEVLGLEELSRHLFLEAHDMQNMRERVEWALTWRGKYFNCLGYFFSLYCMWKIVIVSQVQCILPYQTYFYIEFSEASVVFWCQKLLFNLFKVKATQYKWK